MRQTTRGQLCLCVLFLLVPCVVFGGEGTASFPSLAEIQSQVQQTLVNLEDLVVEYTVLQTPSKKWPAELPLPREPDTWKWSKAGSIELIEMAPRLYPGMDKWYEVRVGIKGRAVSRVDFSSDRKSEIVGVTRSSNIADFDIHISPAHFVGLRIFELDESLLSLLAKPGVTLVGWEDVLGDQCLRVAVGSLSARGRSPASCELWLSKAAGFTPRRIVCKISGEGPDKQIKTMEDLYEIEEYQSILSEDGKHTLFFPKVAVNRGRGPDRRLTVQSVKVGVAQDAKALAINPPDGTEVSEFGLGGPPKVFLVGAKSPADIRAEMVKVASESGPSGPPANATPHATDYWTVGMWCSAAVFFLAAILIRTRRS